jgi:predicted phosphodiesterase
MKNIYIVSDVHGCYKSLLALIEQFPNKQNSKIVFVGDLVDRGKNSYDVVKFVMENKYDCVKGNHEEMLLEYGPTKEELYFNDESKHWLYSGGKIQIRFKIKNIGKVSGAEIAQLYICPIESDVIRSHIELKGFQKIYLHPGEEKEVILELDERSFSVYDVEKKSLFHVKRQISDLYRSIGT